MDNTILIKNGYVIDVIDKNKSGQADILIKNDKIEKIARNIKPKANKVINAKDKIVMPGLINTHNHCAMTILRGYADDLELMDWLNNKIWPIEEHLSERDVYYGSLLACVEMIKSGTTMFNDMYFLTEGTLKAIQNTGIRAMLGRTIMNIENEEDYRVKEAIDLIEKYNNKNSKITFNIAPHATYTCNTKTLEKCIELAQQYNLPIHIHLAETKDEYNMIKEKYKVTPLHFLKNIGILDIPVILAHCVWIDENEMEILTNIKGGISHNPISNCKLASGIAPVPKFIEKGIVVSLGTDGAASTNTLDMFEEMKVCNLLHKVNNLDSTAIDAYTTLQMATINGAKVLGLDDKIGSIEEGKQADIIIIDTKETSINPINDFYSNLVYATTGRDVATTIIDGQIIMEDRKIKDIDEKNIINKCRNIANKLIKIVN